MNKEEKKYIEELQSLNLSEVEARAYYNLLLHDLTAANLTKTLNLNRSYVYELLKKFIEMGLCVEIKGAVRKYRAVEPKIVFNSIVQNYKKQIEKANGLSEELTSLYQTREEQQSNVIVKVLYSKTGSLNTVNRLEDQTQEEILNFSKGPYAMNINNLYKTEGAQKEIRRKTIYEVGNGDENSYKKVVEYCLKNPNPGEEIRIAEFLPMKLAIFDSKIVVFALAKKQNENAGNNFISFFFDGAILANTFKQIFQMYWDSAIPLDEYLKRK